MEMQPCNMNMQYEVGFPTRGERVNGLVKYKLIKISQKVVKM